MVKVNNTTEYRIWENVEFEQDLFLLLPPPPPCKTEDCWWSWNINPGPVYHVLVGFDIKSIYVGKYNFSECEILHLTAHYD